MFVVSLDTAAGAMLHHSNCLHRSILREALAGTLTIAAVALLPTTIVQQQAVVAASIACFYAARQANQVHYTKTQMQPKP
jgi:hypothetical protein